MMMIIIVSDNISLLPLELFDSALFRSPLHWSGVCMTKLIDSVYTHTHTCNDRQTRETAVFGFSLIRT